MKYRPLSKIYYANPDDYESVFRTRKEGEGTLLLPVSIGGNPGFLACTQEMLRLVSEIHRTDKRIRMQTLQLPELSLTQYKASCLIEEVKRTNEIEGIQSARRDIRRILEEGPTHKVDLRWLNGIVGLYKDLEIPLILNRAADVRAIYDELVSGEIARRGEESIPDGALFRRDPVYLKNKHDRIIHKGIQSESEIISAIDNAIEMLQNIEYEELLRIGLFHYFLGYIHPFYDGNGRVARYISSKQLAGSLCPLIGLRLSRTIRQQQEKYNRAFLLANEPRNRGDLTPFVITFLELILDTALGLEEDLSDRVAVLTRCRDELGRITGADGTGERILSLLLQYGLFGGHGLSVPEIARSLGLSQSSVRNYLRSYPSGTVTVTKEGRQNIYDLNLEFMKEELQWQP